MDGRNTDCAGFFARLAEVRPAKRRRESQLRRPAVVVQFDPLSVLQNTRGKRLRQVVDRLGFPVVAAKLNVKIGRVVSLCADSKTSVRESRAIEALLEETAS